ncbi:DegT/DnrJ/EryC1/StrS family aminotransferase [Rubinisphaera italica]|uniref:UDP-4-amino-4-deoxy-L-arabinose--oxoglutarate aminotransferase n=1 Tax=Rubinisphaera italica TaxID=2527969 RepID=A0A5C5X9Z7_9PLAN|nr:DegT/DnrJ/EryC1/StrS aminotransferase family protein [Rubinisphaera italica]TWT59614.1 UDP-4-amino-4-deoxy-L-arabinose--oxoglutarate aminotransferase [Rubinisphaera italica]
MGANTQDLFAAWPCFSQDEIDAAQHVLQSGRVNYWTGQEGRLFEQEFAVYTNCNHAIAVANGTLALELGLYALDLQPGDEVIVPSKTFIASASCVVARGGRPIIADVDPSSQNLTRETIEAVLTPRTKVIIAVHLAGWPCEMDEIMELANEYGLYVIEDCAQAHGAEYKGRPIGSIGDLGAFSFCQDKILTTAGEGGMLVTNNPELWDKAWRYKDHGKTPEAFYNPQPGGTQFRWLHESFGSNMRLSEVQSVVGRMQLQKLPEWIETRNRNANILRTVCEPFAALRIPAPDKNIKHAYYKFYAFINPDYLRGGWTRDRVLEEIRNYGVPCFSGSCSEIYLEEAFPQEWKPKQPCLIARKLGEQSLMFLVHPTLTQANLDSTTQAIQAVMEQASMETTYSVSA